MKGSLSVWVASDSPIFRHGLKHLLRKTRFTVERSGATLGEVLDFSMSPPAVVIIGNDAEPGLEALIRRVQDQWRPSASTRVVMLFSEDNHPVFPATALKSLVDAILPKNMPAVALAHFLEIVALGQQVFLTCPERSSGGGPGHYRGKLLQSAPPSEVEASSPLQPPRNATTAAIDVRRVLPESRNSEDTLLLEAPLLGANPIGLSDRENEIVQCLRQGASNKVIARQLQISESTVKVHIKSLLKKLRVCNRTQAAIWATEARLSRPPQPTFRASDSAPALQA